MFNNNQIRYGLSRDYLWFNTYQISKISMEKFEQYNKKMAEI